MAETELFQDDDAAYLSWLRTHRRGFVLNIARGFGAADAKYHRAACDTINGEPAKGKYWTRYYVKVCSSERSALDIWARRNVQGRAMPTECGTCFDD